MTIDVEEQVVEELEITMPKMWHVIFHNDDKTTMEFVTFLLLQVFHKSVDEATQIMLIVHKENAASAGLFTHEVAESKMNICINTARDNDYPLQVTIEEEK